MAFITASNFISAPLVCFFLSANEKQYQNFGKPPLETTKLEDSRARAQSRRARKWAKETTVIAISYYMINRISQA